MSSQKYPRTPHLPWSRGATNDDKIAKSVSSLIGQPIIITEKMDGSNTCLERKSCFARSHSSIPAHPSFDQFKALHASIKHIINDGLQIFGEWVYAKHSIGYSKLPGYFLLFALRDAEDKFWCPWADVEMWARILNVPTVPVLYQGSVSSEKELQRTTEFLMTQPSVYGGEREGIVVRKSHGFTDDAFSGCAMKNVRANHVQTSEHWKNQSIVKNGLKQ
jgi:RNA ligase-like protein